VNGYQVPDAWGKEQVDRWLRYHSRISYELTSQRTALESALIPITAYIVVACVEAYRRYPELMTEIAAAMPPEEIGARGRQPGNEIDTVRLWSIANFPLVGRTVLMGAGMLDPVADTERLSVVFEFWERASGGYRADGTNQAADAGGVVTPYAALVGEIAAACTPIADAAHLGRVSRLNALLTSYEFLLWFDTRSGYQDSGPYDLGDGRRLLLRHFVKLKESDFAWSAAIDDPLPYRSVLAAFVLEDVDFFVTDFGTAVTDPNDYLPHVRGFALFDTSNGRIEPLGDDAVDPLAAAAKAAQRAQYRQIAAMQRRQKIDCGAYVYFSFLRPFAVAAGIADRLDWTVPRDSLDLYPFLEMIESSPEVEPIADPGLYYPPLP
jgi:hypothetical protein